MNEEGEEARLEHHISTEIQQLEERLAALYKQRGGLVISRAQTGEDDEDTEAWCRCGRNRVRPSDGQDTCDTCLVEA